MTLVIEDPSALSAEVWRALAEAGVRADIALAEAVRRRDLSSAEACLIATGPGLVMDHPGLLRAWHHDREIAEQAGPRLQWALRLDGSRIRPPQPPSSQGADRLVARALRAVGEQEAALERALPTMMGVAVRLRDLSPALRAELGPWSAFLHEQCARVLLAHSEIDLAAEILEQGARERGDARSRRAVDVLRALLDAVSGDIGSARRRLAELGEARADRAGPTHAAAEIIVAVEDGRITVARRLADAHAAAGHPDLLAAEIVLLVAEHRGEDARRRLPALPTRHPMRRILADALAPGGPAESWHRLTGIDDLAARPRARLQRAVREYAVARQLGHISASTAAAQRIVDLMRSSELTWPLLLLSVQDAGALAETTGLKIRGVGGASSALDRLSASERAVLVEMVRGGTEAEIARRLYRSANTVRTQRRSIYRKLAVDNRDDAIAMALEAGLGPPSPRPGAASCDR